MFGAISKALAAHRAVAYTTGRVMRSAAEHVANRAAGHPP